MIRLPIFFATALLFFSCQQEKTSGKSPLPASFGEGAVPASIHLLATPCRKGGEPNLYISADGTPFLSWVEYLNDTTDGLYFSSLEHGQWKEPIEIARGSNWFVNWADFPSLSGFGGGKEKLAAHWLAMAGEGTYDYDVQVAISPDGGRNWGRPFVPHQDGVKAEHGFVTLLPLDSNRMFAAWLDGRNTKTPNEGGHGHGQGAMSLRAGFFSDKGQMLEEQEVDGRVCDCCQTDAVQVPGGLIVAYRDRSEEEARDISVARWINGQWQPPAKVHEDDWKISGCPVNGPALAAHGGQVALAWYTAARDTPRVLLVFSQDGGAYFNAPFRLDGGKPLGRVDVSWMDENCLAVSWMEETGEEAETRLVIVDKRAPDDIRDFFVLVRNSKARASGFPIIEALGENQLLAAWTQADSTGTRVKTAIVNYQ